MANLSEWLELMLAEISRKQDESRRAAEEDARRSAAAAPSQPPVSNASR